MKVNLIESRKIIAEAYVESETQQGMYYHVVIALPDNTCSCPYAQNRKINCKHIIAVTKELNE